MTSNWLKSSLFILSFIFIGNSSLIANINNNAQTTSNNKIKASVILLNQGIHHFDKDKVEQSREQFIQLLKSDQNSDEINYLISKSCLAEANIIRHYDREKPGLSKLEVKQFRQKQKELADTGLIYINAISNKSRQKPNVLTTEGVLYTHKISGMLSGFKNGPKAKKLLRQSLKIQPENPQTLLAYGRMYLYNPPFAGGNLKKAALTYKKVIELEPNEMLAYTLLARTYLKQKKPTQAEFYLKKALEKNPYHKEAKLLLERYGSK